MDLTLAESLDGIYHLVLAGGAFIGCFLVGLGIPGQFLPALLAVACWAGGRQSWGPPRRLLGAAGTTAGG